MNRDTSRTTREAIGCFLMLVLGAFLCLGLMRIAIVGISPPQRGLELWPSLLFWVLAPGVGIAFLGWLTYGSKRLGGRTKGR